MSASPRLASSIGALAALLTVLLGLQLAPSVAGAQGAHGTWTLLPPPILDEAGVAHDRARDRLLVFGGRHDEGSNNDLWALNLKGTQGWTRLETVGPRPPARHAHNVIYDPENDRLWVFGGSSATYTALGDLWTLDLGGSPLTWTQESPLGPAPSARVYATAVLDTLNDRVVLYGGAEIMNEEGPPSNLLGDVWVMPLSGSLQWTQLLPAGTPPTGRAGAQIVWDGAAQRLVVFGGFDGMGMLDDLYTLSLTGSPTWSALAATGGPPTGRAVGAAVWDAAGGRMLVYGGVGGTGEEMFSDLWSLTLGGSPAWTQMSWGGAWPSLRQMPCAAFACHDNALVIYGAQDTTGHVVPDLVWSLNLSGSPQWTQIGYSLPDRWDAAGAFDPVRRQLVVYGGSTWPDIRYSDVWSYDVAARRWTRLSPAGGDPGVRSRHSAIYDPVRDRMVVFGGSDENEQSLNDVWALSLAGTPTWTQLTTGGGSPGPRAEHVAVYDSQRDRMVITGGFTIDTWALDLSTNTWTQLDVGMGGWAGHAGVYDALYDRMVLFAPDASVWALRFSAPFGWTQLHPSGTPPPGRYGVGAAYDATANAMIVFGGSSSDTNFNTTTALLLRGTPAWLPLDFGSTLPTGRQSFAFGYEQSTGTLYVSGGCCNETADTWAATFDRATPVQAALVSATAIVGRAELTWWVPAGTRDVTIQRNAGSGWTPLAFRDPDGSGRIRYQDHEVVAGRRYGYRLAFALDGVAASTEVWIEVPAGAGLSLRGFEPNPALDDARVSFTLGSSAPARLQIVDVAGRTWMSREVGPLGPGSHVVPVEGAPAGLYVLRLTQGGHTLTRKATLLP